MSDEAGKREAPEAGGAKAARVEDELREGTMTVTQRTEETMSPKLAKVMERAKREPEAQFTSLVHLLDQEALGRAFPSFAGRSGGRRRRGDEGAVWPGVGKQHRQAARAAQDDELPAPATAPGSHSQG